jgi:DNA-binding protein YbaB
VTSTSSYEAQLEESLALYNRRREELGDLQRKMSEVSATVTAPRRVVTVTMGHDGEIRDLKFPTAAFKNMTSTELATVVRTTINDARTAVFDQMAELLAPMMPPGLAAGDVVRGKADLTTIMPADPENLGAVFGMPGGER